MDDLITQIRNVLAGLSAPAKRDDEAKQERTRQDSPQFRSFDLFHSNEVLESRICAFLLNPREKHGQGTVFLKAFLSLVDFPVSSTDQHRVVVLREAPCYSLQPSENNGQRRLDILLEFPKDAALAIENKGKGAPDGVRQVDDYLKHLKGAYSGAVRLLYLSPGGKHPHRNSYSEPSQDLRVMDYRLTMNTWLDACYKLCASERVKTYLMDVRHFMGVEEQVKQRESMSEVETEIERIMRDDSSPHGAESLAGLLAAYDARETVWKTAFRIFSERLRKRLGQHHPNWSISEGDYLSEHWAFIRFSDLSWVSTGERYTVELIIQARGGQVGDIGEVVVLQRPTELKLGIRLVPSEKQLKDYRSIRYVTDLRTKEGVEYMLSSFSTDEVANEIEKESVSIAEYLTALRQDALSD
jgi:hypothetical protein